MMERLGVGHFRPDQEVLLPLKSPSGHFAIGQCDNTAVRIKMKRECLYQGCKRRAWRSTCQEGCK